MFEERKLKNGIRVVAERMESMNSIAMGVYVGCGSRYENEKDNGIAHFIEHMLFKGTGRRSAADIAYDMDEIGGQLNAYTSKEYTCFYFRVLSEHFEKGLDILSDMLLGSEFDSDDIKRERTVIDEEISVYEDTPEELVFDRLQGMVWGGKNLGLEILGSHESIKGFDRDMLLKHLKNNYRTDNTVIACAGNFIPERLYAALEEKFGDIAPVSYRNELEKSVYIPGKTTAWKDIEQLHMCIAFPSLAFGEKTHCLSVLNGVTGGGMSSRLFQRIREEKGLCYSVYSTYSSYIDTGIFMIYCALNPSNLHEALKICQNELEEIKAVGISETELGRIKGQLKSSFLLQDENTSSRCAKIGRNTLILGRTLTNAENLGLLDAVDVNSVRELAGRIFDFEKVSLSLVGNIKNVSVSDLF